MRAFFRLFYRSFGEYKAHIAVLASLGFLSGLLGGVGINALVPLFSFVLGKEAGGDDVISRTIRNLFAYFDVEFTIKYLLVFVVALFVLKAMILIVFSYVNGRILADYEEKKRNRLFEATVRANWGYLLKQKLGHLETILMTDVIHTKSLMILISSGLLIAANLLVYAFVAINISFNITLMTFVFGGLVFFSLFKPIVSRVKKISAEDEKTTKEIAHYINENILGMKTVKSMAAEGAVARTMGDYFRRIKNLRIRSALTNMFGGTLTEPISMIFISVIFALSFGSPDFNLAAFLVVIYVSKQIFVYLDQLQSLFVGANSVAYYAQKVLDYEEAAIASREKNEGAGDFVFENFLEFKKVSFSYNDSKIIFEDLNFSIKKGEMIGLIGPSGVGKTTVVDLILRLFRPTSGEILVDGKNVETMDLRKWRNSVGYVSQDIFLMNDTIMNNIKFYDPAVSDSDMIAAAKEANIYETIQSLPDKFFTNIGERGVLLSVGQRQRIAIARILAKKPKFLIFDEATSALDNESEQQIQKVIDELKGKITVLVIAHRLSTIMNSDRLIVLDGGRVAEQGSPQVLLGNKDSYFYKVYNIRK